MNTAETKPPKARLPGVSLFLRHDGTLLLASAANAVEITLTVEQLLTLGLDCLTVAVKLKPECLVEATKALESTRILMPVQIDQVGVSCLH